LLASAPAPAAPAAATGADVERVLVVGDSLSAEYGLQRGQGWVALLQARLRDAGSRAQVINASISGDTTAGGVQRLPALLEQHEPQLVLIELGANDALRGLPLTQTRRNLERMIALCKKASAHVVLIGIQVPPNYGPQYTQELAKLYPDLAHAERVGLVPFLLHGVADVPDARRWFQSDGLHPIAQAEPLMLDNVWKAVGPILTPAARRTAPHRRR
jgi:acyl-CoA thioesterase-1